MDRSRVKVVTSWFFIIAIIVIIQITMFRGSSKEQSAELAQDMQIKMSGKYLVGIKQLSGQNPLLKERFSQLEQGILKSNGNNRDLSGIPILAEISGRDAALQEIERMAKNSDKVIDGKNIPVFYQLYKDGSTSLDSSQLRILKGYGWIGRLALSQDKPDSDPERKAVLRSALIMVILMGLLTMLMLAVLISGLVLLVIAIVQGIKRKLRSHLVVPEDPRSLLLESFAIYLVLSIVLPFLLLLITPGFRSGSILMSVIAGLFPILWLRLRGLRWKDYGTALGWNRGKGVFREIGAGILGYITGLPLLLGALFVVMILAKYAAKMPTHPVVLELSRHPLYLFLLACVYAPFVEETLFRGALYGYLRRSLPWVVSGIVSSLIFAILHPQGWVAVPAIGVIGFNLCTIREWRGSVIASMTAHAMNNGALVLLLVLALS